MKQITYKKTVPTRKSKLANFKGISCDCYSKNVPINYAFRQDNLKVLNGCLVSSPTPKVVDIQIDGKIADILPFYLDKQALLVDNENKYLLLTQNDNKIVVDELEKDFDILAYANYKYAGDNFIVLATENGLVKFDGKTFEKSDVNTKFATLCNHNYRMFGALENSTKLLFSDDFAPFNWNVDYEEGGYINLPSDRGFIQQLISFNQYLIIVQENGFAKLNAYTDQEDFALKLISSPNSIKKNSVVNCGSYLMYVDSKGLGIFDGYECKNICEELASYFCDKNVCGVVVGSECYFLCTDKSDFGECKIFCYDLIKKTYNFITSDNVNKIASSYCQNKKYLLMTNGNSLQYLMYGNKSNGIWKTGKLDFGFTAEYKILKSIVIGGDTVVNIKISVDGKNYFFNIASKRKIILNLKGKLFEIELNPKGKHINVPSPILEYQVLEDY